MGARREVLLRILSVRERPAPAELPELRHHAGRLQYPAGEQHHDPGRQVELQAGSLPRDVLHRPLQFL